MKSAHKKENNCYRIIVTEAGRQLLHTSSVPVFVCSFVFLSVSVFVIVFVVLIPLATICYQIIVTRTGRQLLHRANKQPMMSWWVWKKNHSIVTFIHVAYNLHHCCPFQGTNWKLAKFSFEDWASSSKFDLQIESST